MKTQEIVQRRHLPNAIWQRLEPLVGKIKERRGSAGVQSDRAFIEAVI